MKRITHIDLEKILGFEIDPETKEKINSYNLEYRDLNKEERDQYILNVVNVLTNDITISGKHRINEWESGWGENLNLFKESKNIEDLIPKYHGKNRLLKWNGDIIMPLVDGFDYKLHICLVDSIVKHYLKDYKNIFELGCGPAYHLVRLSESFKDKNFFGTDWATSSQEIIKEINKIKNSDITPINLDFFSPDKTIKVPKNSGFYTVASLEQIGENFKELISFILEKKPEICVHLEPIDELLDQNILMDNLTIKYFRKRNYLKNFLPYLEQLEKENKIKIIKKQRTYSGSYFIEGHSLIVWKPL